MEIITCIAITIMALCGATKKNKPVFGQMTLTGQQALDWVKDGVRVTASKIQMGSPALFDEWNIPEWGLTKDVIAIIFPTDKFQNPFLVTQKSILKILEAQCCEWEEAGATCDVGTGNGKTGNGIRRNVAQIVFNENEPTFEFIRPEDAKTYDPYKVVIE